MRSQHRPALLAAIAVVVLFAVPSGWSGSLSGGSTSPTVSPPIGAPSTLPPAAFVPAGPHPAIVCPPYFPTYSQVGNPAVWPIVPDQLFQFPCPRISEDEVHASFGSTTSGSGQRWTMPVHVPIDGTTRQIASYLQFYVGMVVTGNAFSEGKQTYAAVIFQPSGAPVSTYLASVHLFSFLNMSHVAGYCPGMELSWNDSFYCEQDDMANSSGQGSLVAGDWVNLTFAGSRSQTSGLDIWLNDSTTPGASFSMVLNQTNTGVGNFEPYFDASCPDSCVLGWSVKSAFGLGMGFAMCPLAGAGFAPCDSYNDTTYNGTHPVEFGIPHFWLNGGYNGDYRYFAPESTSGACNFNAPIGTLTTCYNNDRNGGTGYYPEFNYNGTVLDYGVTHPWTTQDWGGSIFEMLSTGAANDLTPFYFHAIANDSRAGFVAPGGTLTVTTHLQDLGNVRYAGVTYRVNNGGSTAIPMTLVSGTRNDGTWSATIPSGPNGWINYTVNATNNASAQLLTPNGGNMYHVQRGPLPTFSIQALSSLGTCGGVEINGTGYASGTIASLQPGTYPIVAIGCYPYVFSSWTLAPGITVVPSTSLSGNVTISANGTIESNWRYVRPLDTIMLYTNPTLCGQIILDGQSYFPISTGSPAQILDNTNVSLGVTGCGGYSFSGWNFTGSFTILGNNFISIGNGSLYANFVQSTSSFTIIFHTYPSTCGGILFRGAGYIDGQSLAELAGSYPIAGDPCYHWGFLQFATTGGLSVSGGTLTVTGSGTIAETDYVLTIVTFVTSPPNCGFITWDGTDSTNGQTLVVANNSTHSVTATACTGFYLFGITGTDGITVTGNIAYVNGSGNVIATFLPGSPTNFVGFLTDPSTCGAILFSGIRYTSSNYTYVAQGSQATVIGQPCSSYGFVKWVTFGGITVIGSTAYLNGPGALEAIFRPLAAIFLYTSPIGCGSIEIANVSYTSNSSVELTEDRSYTIGTTPCTGYAFSQWINSSGALIGGGLITLTTGAVLTAEFLPVRYSVGILVNPPRCGGVRVSGQDVGNGTVLTLSHGQFPISPSPCAGDHLVRWDLLGNLSITNTTLWVNGSGTISAIYQPVPPTLTLDVATGSLAGILVPFGATVAVLVPPYTYTYTWTFGDGASATTPVNFTSHAYASPGFYHVSVMVTDPLNRTANATGTIQVIAQSATSLGGLTPISLAAIGLAVVAILVIVVLGARFRRPPAEPTPSLAAPTPTAPDEGGMMNADATEMEAPKP